MATLTLEPVGVESWIDPTAVLASLCDAGALELVTLDVPAGDDPSTPALTTLADWLRMQAAWYHAQEDADGDTGTAGLAAETLELAADSAEFHGATTPRQLVRLSPWYRRINLGQVAVPEARRSRVAELLEGEAADWLIDRDRDCDARRFVAAALLQVADRAEALGARTVAEYYGLMALYTEHCESLEN